LSADSPSAEMGWLSALNLLHVRTRVTSSKLVTRHSMTL
jgi:hypothetical protein